ncbi:RluA family pseudouridine synthase [Nannocystis radixulma]|uniref:RluA family pseudouridine synthase n=1 Tax=Nannocystis radixulma TaxID=2995305 RepID=UPI0023EE8A4C|nr:RluA family pseudouridine synthase [Nannocystis radixulma]
MRLHLGSDAIGRRLDQALVAELARRGHPCTRSQLARAFAAGKVCAAGGVALKASRLVDAEVEVEVELQAPAPLHATPEALPLQVVFEDEHLLVIDKPAGMVVHAGPGHSHGTLVNAVLHHLGLGAEELPVLPGNDATRPGIVHRLDRDTSGLLVVAKHMQAQEGLAAQFRRHSLRRRYLGVVRDTPPFREKTLRTGHGRDPVDRRRFTWDARDGRRAVTHVRTLERLTGAALLGFQLETGRTHQIRMHCRMLGHPIVGDALYGGLGGPPAIRALAESLGRHALHAAVLGFRHPISGAELDFESALPPELRALIVALGGPDS